MTDNQMISVLLVEQLKPLPLFAAGSLIERWNRLVDKLDIDMDIEKQTIKSDVLTTFTTHHSGKKVIVFADWIVDNMTVEYVLESLSPTVDKREVLFVSSVQGLLPIIIAGEGTLKAFEKWSGWNTDASLDDFKHYLEECEGVVIQVKDIEKGFWSKITDEQSVKDAEWGLLKLLQFRPGGLVAQYCNRPFSIRMTRRILKYRWITANLVTIVDFFIGLLALSFFLIPSYWAAIIATILLQLNSIVDGVDGEVARVRKDNSYFGANLDSLSDETLGALLYPAIGYHLMGTGHSFWFFVIGVITGVVSYTYAMVNFHARFKSDNNIGFYYWWELHKPVKVRARKKTIVFYLKRLLWRESIIFFLMFMAIFGVLHYFIIIAFLPAVVNAILMFIHIFIKKALW